MFEMGAPGGQIMQSSEIENYPGVFREGMTGMDLMEPWPEQCMHFGLKHEMAEVKRVTKDGEHFTLHLDGDKTVDAMSVVVATGSTPRRAGFNGEEEFFGRGVSTCATCDGFFYKGKEVAVLGGGDTALEEALYLANICSKVYVIHRRDAFRAAPPTVERIMKNDKIELVLDASIEEAFGGMMGLDGLKIAFKDGSKRTLDVPGVFVFVGNNVNNHILRQADGSYLCATNDNGEVIVDLKMRTDVTGLYAAGDLRVDAAKQVVCAASDGALAGMQALEHVLEHA
jgi:thioredoxin reductase (NADPH)